MAVKPSWKHNCSKINPKAVCGTQWMDCAETQRGTVSTLHQLSPLLSPEKQAGEAGQQHWPSHSTWQMERDCFLIALGTKQQHWGGNNKLDHQPWSHLSCYIILPIYLIIFPVGYFKAGTWIFYSQHKTHYLLNVFHWITFFLRTSWATSKEWKCKSGLGQG